MGMTREEWLQALGARIADWYPDDVPTVYIGVGFPSTGVRSKRVGECWKGECSSDGVPHIFIHPSQVDAVEVAAILAHELIHACRPDAKHGAKFKAVALALGLTGKMTATTPGPAFADRIAPILEDLGPYPHAQLTSRRGTSSAGPKQTTRMLKLECGECGYTARTTRKWLDLAGPPLCPSCVQALAEAA